MMKKTLKKLVMGLVLLTVLNGCSEFALLASSSSIAISHNTYVKAYNGIDVLTIMGTEKDIKTHIYTKTKELIHDQRRQ